MPSTHVVQSTEKRPNILINRNFALLFVGGAISNVGDFVFNTTLVLWIATVIARNQSWAPAAVSGCLVAGLIPTLLIGPVAGVFVDRWIKRATMLRMDILRGLIVAALLLTTYLLFQSFIASGPFSLFSQLGVIYVAVFLVSTCSQFFEPARLALIGDIVEGSLLPRAMGFMQTAVSLAAIIGPALAAPLFFAVGVQWALLVNACSFIISFGTILAIHAPKAAQSVAPEERGNIAREFMAGLKFFGANQVLMALLIAGIILIASDSSLNTLDIFFVTQNLHTNPNLYGNLLAVLGVGAVTGAFVASFVTQRIGVTRTFWLALILFGGLILVYSRLTSYVSALPLLFLLGLVGSALLVAVYPILLQTMPRELIGRVTTVLGTSNSFSALLSMVLVGYLDSTVLQGFHHVFFGIQFGAVDTIFTVAGVLCIGGGIYAMLALRNLGQNSEEASPPAEGALLEEGAE